MHKAKRMAFAAAEITGLLGGISATMAAPISIDQPNALAFPELAPDMLLPAIIADLKQEIADPYSIRDFQLCPVRHLKLENGRPSRWFVDFGINAKAPAGGYAGMALYTIGFRNGVVTYHAHTAALGDKQGLNSVIARENLNFLKKCSPIPDAKIQALLTAGSR